MQQTAPEVLELDALAQAAKVDIDDALSRAGVAKSTYWRWLHGGQEPLTSTVRKVRAAIHQIATDRAA